jgi:hypothetical protein
VSTEPKYIVHTQYDAEIQHYKQSEDYYERSKDFGGGCCSVLQGNMSKYLRKRRNTCQKTDNMAEISTLYLPNKSCERYHYINLLMKCERGTSADEIIHIDELFSGEVYHSN